MTTARITAGLILLCTLTACSGGGSSSGPAETRFLSIGTAPPGGTFFIIGGAIGDVLNAHKGPIDWAVTAEATSGSQENIRRLAQGEIDFAISNSAVTYFAVRGEEGWDKPYPIRSVMTLAPNVALFVAPKSAGIRTIADLRGKRVVIGPAGAGFETFVTPLLAAHGLALEDFTALNNTQTGAVDMLADGSADAAFLGGGVPTASIVQAASSMDLTYIPFDPQAVEKLVAEYLFFRPARIPAGTYRGLDQDFLGLDVGSMHLITAADQDEDLVYQVTRTIYEQREAVAQKHASGKSINAENVARPTGTEFHPGAVRYYREIGVWQEPAAGGGSR